MKNYQTHSHSHDLIKAPSWLKVFANIFLCFLFVTLIILFLVPWQQTSQGTGSVIAIDPNDRVQNINSPITGRIQKWFVFDGSSVKEGDPIVQLADNDPNFLERLKTERDAIFKTYQAKKNASETAQLNLNRQSELYQQGLASKVNVEKAQIVYKKLLAEEAQAAAKLAETEVRLSRQLNQLVTAPRNGTILRVLHGSGNVFVNESDVLAVFVPDTQQESAEIYIDGNDLPLIYPGRKVRLQFEGWPAVQFSGWPSVAIGTFGGVVRAIDPSISSDGRFRVIVVPDKDQPTWPDQKYLRQGTRVYGWVLLNTVTIGYELWRKFNGFPPAMENPSGGDDTINSTITIKDNKINKKKKKDKK